MGLWAPLPRAAGAVEWLDRPAPFADRARSLEDVARLNGVFGGRLITLGHVKRLLRRVPAGRTATVLDLGTGSADVPRALARWARRVGRPLRVLALDRDAATLRIARRTVRDYPEIVLLQADALALPLRPGSVDVVISALTLHHLEPAAAAAYLSAMDGAARLGFVVNDLAAEPLSRGRSCGSPPGSSRGARCRATTGRSPCCARIPGRRSTGCARRRASTASASTATRPWCAIARCR